ncbi:NAD(+)/NADH kinase [Halococcus hamelinensis]|uniref:NAD kinase n=1 Tax=Halococcus hamelinensis 100A6 TaxID=1132509 RepID=M0M4C1_9EURY|nr:NAD(+)/NADH kinase [Halococcus hamelinensis]EMA40657.1 NAD(+) kinase [Halococcus hamelinensis 100A6]
MKVGIVARRGNDRAAALADDTRDRLHESGIEVLVDEATADALGVAGHAVTRMNDADLVVSIGGDGTFLFAARGAGTTPVMGINLGEVGFLNVTAPENALAEIDRAVEQVRETGNPEVRTVPRLRATGENVSLPPALNEVVVATGRGPGRGGEFAVEVDGDSFFESHADGVLVATPAGSTAYSLSEGGPLVHSDVPGLIVTDMCATDPRPPAVVDAGSEVTVRVTDAPDAVVVGDGRTRKPIEPPADLTIHVADEPMRIAGPPLDFFGALDKLD